MSNELVQIVEVSGLEQTKGQKLLQLFTPYFNRMAEIESKINLLNKDNPGKEDVKIAKEIRLALKSNRIASEKIKDDSKAAILVEGRLIDNLNNIIKNSSKPLEEKCEQIEKFAEIQEQRRKEERKANRIQLLKHYEPGEGYFSFNYDLLNLTDEAFEGLLSGAKLNHEARIETAKRIETERIAKEKAEAEERERIRQENIKLKAEREEREKQIAIERAKAEAERKISEEKARIERAKQEAKFKAEREERLRIETELRLKIEKEAAEKKAKTLLEKKAKSAPDKEKLINLARSIESLPEPTMSTDEGYAILQKANQYIDTAVKILKDSAREQL